MSLPNLCQLSLSGDCPETSWLASTSVDELILRQHLDDGLDVVSVDKLKALQNFEDGVISKEDADDPGSVLYSFKHYALEKFVFLSFEVLMLQDYISQFLSRDMPADLVDFNSEMRGPRDATPDFMHMYSFRVDLRLTNTDGGKEPFKLFRAMTYDEKRRARLYPSKEEVQVKYRRSVWSQHFPATEETDHFVLPQPVLTSHLMTPEISSNSFESSYSVEDIMLSFFTREVWDHPDWSSRDTGVKSMDRKPDYANIALHKIFEAMEVTDIWESHTMCSFEKRNVFAEALSYRNVDNTAATLAFFGIRRICLAVVLYRLLILTDDAITDMYVKSPDGPLHIMNLQELHKQNGTVDSPLKAEVARLKKEIEQLQMGSSELPRKAARN